MEASSSTTGCAHALALRMLDAWFDRPSEARERLEDLISELSAEERRDVEQTIRVVERLEACSNQAGHHFRTRSIREFRQNVGRFLRKTSDERAGR